MTSAIKPAMRAYSMAVTPESLPTNSSIPVLAQFKKALLDRGYNLQLNYTGEALGNPIGGVKQGGINEGLLEMSVDGDVDKIAGLKGATYSTPTSGRSSRRFPSNGSSASWSIGSATRASSGSSRNG